MGYVVSQFLQELPELLIWWRDVFAFEYAGNAVLYLPNVFPFIWPDVKGFKRRDGELKSYEYLSWPERAEYVPQAKCHPETRQVPAIELSHHRK
jgi:hypothetical protein